MNKVVLHTQVPRKRTDLFQESYQVYDDRDQLPFQQTSCQKGKNPTSLPAKRNEIDKTFTIKEETNFSSKIKVERNQRRDQLLSEAELNFCEGTNFPPNGPTSNEGTNFLPPALHCFLTLSFTNQSKPKTVFTWQSLELTQLEPKGLSQRA